MCLVLSAQHEWRATAENTVRGAISAEDLPGAVIGRDRATNSLYIFQTLYLHILHNHLDIFIAKWFHIDVRMLRAGSRPAGAANKIRRRGLILFRANA